MTTQTKERTVRGERERWCNRCLEWWPASREFFYTTGNQGRLHSWCKACYQERRKLRRAK